MPFWCCWTWISCWAKLSIRFASSQSDLCIQWGLAPESEERREGPLDARRPPTGRGPSPNPLDDDEDDGQPFSHRLLPLYQRRLLKVTDALDLYAFQDDHVDVDNHTSRSSSHSPETPSDMDDCLRALRTRRRRR